MEYVQQEDTHRNIPIRNIISSIITSETFYVECLTKMLHVSQTNAALYLNTRTIIMIFFGFILVHESNARHIDHFATSYIGKRIPNDVFQN